MGEESQKESGENLLEIVKRLSTLEERVGELEKKKAGPKKKKTPGVKKESDHRRALSSLRDAFLGSFKATHGHEYPGWGPKEYGMAAHWLRSVPLDKALEYCAIYPRWKQREVIRAGHPFGLLVMKYVELDAHIKRYPKLVAEIIQAQARENVEILSQVKDAEVLAHATRFKDDRDKRLLETGQDEIQKPALDGVPGPRLSIVGE